MPQRDTTSEAASVQLNAQRRLTPADRVRLTFELSAQTVALTTAGVRHRHPEYTPEEVEAAVRRVRLDDDELFRGTWPDALLLDP